MDASFPMKRRVRIVDEVIIILRVPAEYFIGPFETVIEAAMILHGGTQELSAYYAKAGCTHVMITYAKIP